MADDTYAKNLAEARALGAILPCHWTAEQRERVIALTGKAPAEIDEIIACSRMINGLDPAGPVLTAILGSVGAHAAHIWGDNYDGEKYCMRCGHAELAVRGRLCRP